MERAAGYRGRVIGDSFRLPIRCSAFALPYNLTYRRRARQPGETVWVNPECLARLPRPYDNGV
jgi:hypothetical protein